MLAAVSRANNIIQLLFSILIFMLVLAVTWFVTKWIGNYQSLQSKHRNVEVIETARIANGKYIQIVRVADAYFAIAVCKDTVTFLSELDEHKIQKEQPSSSESAESFQDILKKIKTIKK